MLPLIAAAAAPAVLQMGGSILGGMMGGGDAEAEAAAEARRRALEELLATKEETGPSAYENEDPRARESQIAALSQLEQTYKTGGMDPQAQAALRGAQTSNAAAERGSREALTMDAASRGLSSSGASLMGKLVNGQGSANRNASAGAAAAGDARTRALQAMQAAGGAAGAVRSGDFQKSGALDSINEFNANQRLRKAGMVSGVYTGQAGDYADAARKKDEEGRAQGAGIGTAVTGIGSKRGWW